MKILPVTFFSYTNKSNNISPYKKQENYQDTFVKQNNLLTFRGNAVNENPYQQVLQNPTLTQKVMELITTAATILVGKAANINVQNEEKDINIEEICKDITEDKTYDNAQISQYEEELKQLKEENLRLKELLNKDNQSDNISSNTEPEPIQTKYVFEFPKKRAGILSQSQKELKEITSKLDLDETSGEKMNQICKELLNNGSHKVDNEIIDNKDLIKDFIEKLSNSDAENLNQILDEFYEKCELNSKDAEQIDIPEEPEKSAKSKNAKPEIFETEKIVLSQPKVLGKIEIKEKERKRARFKCKPEDTRVIIGTEQDPISKVTKNSTELELMNPKTKSAIFRVPGTANKNVMINLKHLLLKFEHSVESEDPNVKYQNSRTLNEHVKDYDILEEIKNQNDGQYQYIDKKNAAEVADAINSDPRFHKMFTLHAAMRLIDRFVDFNSDEPIDQQCHNILDKLTEVLQKSFKEGLEVRRYVDPANKIGLRVFISEDVYDDGAKAIFGSYPFRLGICENQPNPKFYDKFIKEPLICTIFAKGI